MNWCLKNIGFMVFGMLVLAGYASLENERALDREELHASVQARLQTNQIKADNESCLLKYTQIMPQTAITPAHVKSPSQRGIIRVQRIAAK